MKKIRLYWPLFVPYIRVRCPSWPQQLHHRRWSYKNTTYIVNKVSFYWPMVFGSSGSLYRSVLPFMAERCDFTYIGKKISSYWPMGL